MHKTFHIKELITYLSQRATILYFIYFIYLLYLCETKKIHVPNC